MTELAICNINYTNSQFPFDKWLKLDEEQAINYFTQKKNTDSTAMKGSQSQVKYLLSF